VTALRVLDLCCGGGLAADGIHAAFSEYITREFLRNRNRRKVLVTDFLPQREAA
jgi:hypothetical protein